MYESIIDIVGGEARMLFIKLTYELATEDSERIGLDHVARISSTNETTQSKVSEMKSDAKDGRGYEMLEHLGVGSNVTYLKKIDKDAKVSSHEHH